MRLLLIGALLIALPYVLGREGAWLQGERRGGAFPADFFTAVSILQTEQGRAHKLGRRIVHNGIRDRIVGEMIAGQIKLPEAINQLCGMCDREEMKTLFLNCQQWEKGATDRERICRCLLELVHEELRDDCQSSTHFRARGVLGRLEQEMDTYLRNEERLVADATP